MVYFNNCFHYFFINQEEVSTTQEKFKLLQAIIISNDMWLQCRSKGNISGGGHAIAGGASR